MNYDQLESIQDQFRDNSGRLTKMIAKRLSVTDQTNPMIWSYICECLRSPTVMRYDVAEAIEREKGAENASGSSEKRKSEPKPVTRTEETTQSSRKRGRDADPPASNPKKAKAIQPGKSECEQVLMKIGHELKTTQSSRKRGRDADPPASNPKRAKAIQLGKIEGDQVLMKICRELGDQWMDVGVALGMEYKDLKNTIENNPKIPHHLKPMEMFQKWKNKAGDSFTYATLATALEEADLDTCAQTHCYE